MFIARLVKVVINSMLNINFIKYTTIVTPFDHKRYLKRR